MRLLRLIADFNLVEARLTHSLERDVSLQTRVTLMRRAAALMDSIERHNPDDQDGLNKKITFFLARARRSRSRRELQIALDLIESRNCGQAVTKPCQSRSSQPFEVLDRLVRRGIAADNLIAHITAMPQRASLLDREFRHLCTSRGNLEFHASPQARFTGVHIGDLIGAQRYNERAKAQVTAALCGTSRAYYYTLNVPTMGNRVMQCAMRPWLKPCGEVSGVMMWVNDVTDRLTPQHDFGDVPFAAPDHSPHHSIDGTT